MLHLKNVNVAVGSGSRFEKKILEDFNLSMQEGELVVVIGPNGAGKSTLLGAISGGVSLDSGKIQVAGKEISSLAPHQRTALIAQVLQDPKNSTMGSMTLEENLSFAYKRGQRRGLVPYSTKARRDLFRKKLSLLGMGLENRMNELSSNLSGGQQQALSLVMAMTTESKILLLDEITSALDPKMADRVMEITNNLVKQSKQTTLMITHHMSYALKYGDLTLVLKDGKIFKTLNTEDKKNLSLKDLRALFDNDH